MTLKTPHYTTKEIEEFERYVRFADSQDERESRLGRYGLNFLVRLHGKEKIAAMHNYVEARAAIQKMVADLNRRVG